MAIVRPTWSSWSFLVYAGGLTFALAASGWLAYLSSKSGPAGDFGWALLVLAVLAAIAEWFRRTSHGVTAGVFAFGMVGAAVGALAALFLWIGWSVRPGATVHGFHPALLVLEAAWAGIAAAALRRYRFPFLVVHVAFATWLFVADLLTNGGSRTAVVSLLVGLAYLTTAVRLDGGERRPYGFWLHVAAGVAIGGAVLHRLHHGTFEWVLVAVVAVAYVVLARRLDRSSWAVLGAVGLFVVAEHFAVRWESVSFLFLRGHGHRPWAPLLVFSCLGVLLVALGLAVGRPRPSA